MSQPLGPSESAGPTDKAVNKCWNSGVVQYWGNKCFQRQLLDPDAAVAKVAIVLGSRNPRWEPRYRTRRESLPQI